VSPNAQTGGERKKEIKREREREKGFTEKREKVEEGE